jgi:hypothetical protein
MLNYIPLARLYALIESFNDFGGLKKIDKISVL